MTEPTAATPNAPESAPGSAPESAPEPAPQPAAPDSAAPDSAAPAPAPVSGESAAPTDDAPAETQPAPTIIVLTEEALKPVDVDKIVALHKDEQPTYRVLVPADTERNLLSTFLDHLSLFEMREALDSLRPIDRGEAHADAGTALESTLAEFAQHDVAATGEITADDPVPTLIEEVARLKATEVVIVTEPHAVEDTFHRDWASRARDELGLPVLHMYAGDWRLG